MAQPMAENAEYEYPDLQLAGQLAGLVEAATAAAEEQTNRESSNLGKRKRNDDVPTDPALLDQDGPASSDFDNPEADLLFKPASEKSKRYSRPALEVVFNSHQLAAENFLKLQNAAKAYMLDPNHPERYTDTVGYKRDRESGSMTTTGTSDASKIRLYQVTQDFLGLGYGQQFWGHGVGENVPNTPPRKIFWPEHAQEITKVLMPLLRKTVTNERQRVYATEKRRIIAEEKERNRVQNDLVREMVEGQQGQLPVNDIGVNTDLSTDGIGLHSRFSPSYVQPYQPPEMQTTLIVNILSKPHPEAAPQRIMSQFAIAPSEVNNPAALLSEVRVRIAGNPGLYTSSFKLDLEDESEYPIVKIHLSDGLTTVKTDDEYTMAIINAGTVEWMDGEIRVLVEV